MKFIHAVSSITNQRSFNEDKVFENLQIPEDYLQLETVDYKAFIPPAALRRLSVVLKNSLCCAHQLTTQYPNALDGIIIGTGLGCLNDTEKFLNTIYTSNTETLSPTAFIQSTHNTIAGQISLALQNHGYNMTHTQHCLSFETALADAMQLLNEDANTLMVGAGEEHISFLNRIGKEIYNHDFPLSQGVSLLLLSNEVSKEKIGISSLRFFIQDQEKEAMDYLNEFNLMANDTLIYNGNEPIFKHQTEMICLTKYVGHYVSNSAFGLHMAFDLLKNNSSKKRIILVNNLNSNSIAITEILRNEA
jgi:hypothetical protein